MPIIRVEMFKGRTAEQKKKIARELIDGFIRGAGGGQEAPHGRDQFLGLEGLGHEVVHASIQAALAILRHHAGTHRDDGQLGRAMHASQRPRGLNTVQAGHLQVHQCHVGPQLPEQRHALGAVVGLAHHHHVGLAPDHRRDALPHQGMVIDREDLDRGGRAGQGAGMGGGEARIEPPSLERNQSRVCGHPRKP